MGMKSSGPPCPHCARPDGLTCPDCALSPSRLHLAHSQTPNHDEDADFQLMVVDLRRTLAAKQAELDAMRKTVAEVAQKLLLLLAREARR